MTLTVLVNCTGSIPGIAIIQALKQQQECPIRVVAVDTDPLSAGLYLADVGLTVPPSSDPSYLPMVLSLCQREGVGMLFPVLDEELLLFAQAKERFAEAGVRVISNDPDLVNMARDKYATYTACRSRGIAVPETWLLEEVGKIPAGRPLVVKPRRGRGTQDVFMVQGRKEAEAILPRVHDPIIQERLDGPEYTIDVLTDFDGRLISVVPKARLATKAGMQVKGRTIKEDALLRYGEELHRIFRLTPRANIQCILAEKKLWLIEINPKFPASLPFTVAAGVNGPLLLAKMHLGESVAPMLGQFRDGLVMLRYWQELYVEPARSATGYRKTTP